MASLHAYYPLGVVLPNYAHNESSTLTLISIFAVVCIALLTTAKVIITKVNPRITRLALTRALWFVLCGGIHLVLEGYYASHFTSLQGSQHVLAQLWKEYSLSDSRYLTKDAFVMVMESVTAWAWGPLSFLLALLITLDSPYQHPLQILISTGQLYGDVLYFGIAAFDMIVYGVEYSRPEPYYYYGYYVMMNGFWIVIPSMLIFNSFGACSGAFRVIKELQGTKKRS